MNTLLQLYELSLGWDVKLTSHEVGPGAVEWELRITRRDSWHLYRGELEHVVARAWAGERGEASGSADDW